MPHITQAVKDAIANGTHVEYKVGDACYLFSQWMLGYFNANPSWKTIHEIRVASRAPFHNDEVHAIINAQLGTFNRIDLEAAADLAFLEFYRLVVAKYEDVKIAQNGDAFAGACVPTLTPVSTPEAYPTEVTVNLVRGRGRPKGSKNKEKVA